MRRWLAVLLLVFLPLQHSWAAVANYCGHETGAAAKHVGHHDHAGHGHAGKDVKPGQQAKSDGTVAGASNIDCGHCHGYCAGMVDVSAAFEPEAPAGAPPALRAHPGAELMPAPPERPQWAALA